MLKQHRFLIPAIIILIILAAVGGGWWLSLPRGDELPASIRVTPSAQEESGIVPDAYFAVTSDFAVHESDLRGMLDLDPAINYTLEGSGKEWTLRPVMPLRENTVYTIRVNNASGAPVQSFAFQTRSDLLVGSVYPGDQETYVDINAGIEIRFNRPGVDLSKGFSILPAVSGRFETQDYSCRFIPNKPLEHNSIYRVTLQSLRSADGALLKEPYTFSFETEEEEGAESWDDLSTDKFAASFLPSDQPQVLLRGGERQAAGNYTMTLHKYTGIRAYAAVLREHDDFYREQYGVKEPYRAETEGLDEVMNVTGGLMNSDGRLYASLPEDLSEGFYLFTLTGEGGGNEQFVQQLIQVVNLSVYTQSVNGETIFWIGDPVTGETAEAAVVEMETEDGSISAETDENGVAALQTGDSKWAYATVIREGTPVWVDSVPLAAESERQPLSRGYYAALYTDREIYLPGDAVQFWGVVKPRGDQPAPKTVRAALSTHWPKNSLSGITVDVAEDGTFSGVLTPDALQAGSYFLSVTNGGEDAYLERYIQVSEYTKPAYEITLSTDKEIYYYGETVSFTVSASYYDGTPASGAKLLADCYEARLENLPVTLDQNGQASFKGVLDPAAIQPGEGRVAGWEPRYVGWSVRSADEQAVNLSQWATLRALPSKIAAEAVYEGDGKLTISTAVLNEAKLLDQEGDPAQSEFQRLRGVPADIPVTLVVHKVTTHQIQTGSWYDYVNKRSVPVYETRREETVDRNTQVSTVSGKAVVTDLPAAETDNVGYWFEVRFAGGVYGDVSTDAYPVSLYRSYGEDRYTFFSGRSSQTAAPGETLETGLYINGAKAENTGAVFYTLVQDSVVEQGVFREDTLPLTVKPDYMPNIWLVGAYFDGKAIHPMDRVNISCDYGDRVLDVQADTDRTEYSPGDEMKVTLTVTGADGKPVNGRAAVGVVDEAVFSLSEQRVDLAGQLYADIYYPDIVLSATEGGYGKKAPANMSAAKEEMAADAGGGDGGVRSVFADTADFQTVEVQNGRAQVTLKLPDNVTAWRVTAAAVTADLQAGDGITKAVSTLPFYLRPIVSETYLAGDDISVSALAVGTALSGGETVKYTASLSGPGDKSQRQEAEAPAGTRTAFNFGQLGEGDYHVTLSAEMDGWQDRVELPLTVASTGLLVPKIETMPLTELASVKSARWPVTATVFDVEMKPAFDTLSWLSAQNGQRTEIIAAASRAMELYNSLRPADQREDLTRDPRLNSITGDDGGILPLPGSQSDTALTAKLLMAAPELCSTGAAAEYLRDALKNPAAAPEDRIMAYVGLAAAKEPVLLDLQRLYEAEGAEMAPYLRLYVGAAFARLGDFDRAWEIYGTVKTVRGGDQCHIDDGNIRQATAAALLLATEASHEDAAGLANYLTGRKTEAGKEGSLCNLELLAYAKKILAQSSGENGKFSYYENGVQKTAELKDGAAFISLGAAAADGKFRSVSGSLYAAARVLVPGEGEAQGNFATVTKTYTPVSGSLVPGGQVKVTMKIQFNEDAPYGAYEIADYIPAGLRWLGGQRLTAPANANILPVLRQDGQRINGTLYRMNPEGGVAPLAERVNGAYVRMLAETISGVAGNSGETETPEANSAAEAGEEAPGQTEPAAEAPETPAASSEGTPEEAAGDEEEPEADGGEPAAAEEEIAPEEGPAAEEAPVADTREWAPRPQPAPVQEDPNTYVFEYYLSAALPGSFVTESVWITSEDQAVKSDRGTIAVN